MEQYTKINTIFKRDDKGNLIEGKWSEDSFYYLKNNNWVFTEKIDGTNIRVFWDGEDSLEFGGKTDRAQTPKFLLDKLVEIFTVDKFRNSLIGEQNKDFSSGVLLFGEGYGNRIQKIGKRYIPDGVDFILFDVKIGNWWLQREAVNEIAWKLGIKSVPILGEGTLYDMIDLVKEGVPSQLVPGLESEGIVARPECELLERSGKRIITKLKGKDFGRNHEK